jgi:hypothetical protein
LNLFALAAFAIRLPLFWLAVELCLVARRETPASVLPPNFVAFRGEPRG